MTILRREEAESDEPYQMTDSILCSAWWARLILLSETDPVLRFQMMTVSMRYPLRREVFCNNLQQNFRAMGSGMHSVFRSTQRE